MVVVLPQPRDRGNWQGFAGIPMLTSRKPADQRDTAGKAHDPAGAWPRFARSCAGSGMRDRLACLAPQTCRMTVRETKESGYETDWIWPDPCCGHGAERLRKPDQRTAHGRRGGRRRGGGADYGRGPWRG